MKLRFHARLHGSKVIAFKRRGCVCDCCAHLCQAAYLNNRIHSARVSAANRREEEKRGV